MFKLLSLASVGYFIKNNVRQIASIALVVVLYAVLSDVIDTLKMPEYEYENKFIVIFLIYVFEVIVIVSALIFVNLTYTKVSADSEVEDKQEVERMIKDNVPSRDYRTRSDNIIARAQDKVKHDT